MRPRRRQASITFQSDWAKERLKLLTRDGRSQAAVIEDALARLSVPAEGERDARRARIEAIIDRLSRSGLPTMAEFDREEYDEDGNPR